jgi:hypothetical protein
MTPRTITLSEEAYLAFVMKTFLSQRQREYNDFSDLKQMISELNSVSLFYFSQLTNFNVGSLRGDIIIFLVSLPRSSME